MLLTSHLTEQQIGNWVNTPLMGAFTPATPTQINYSVSKVVHTHWVELCHVALLFPFTPAMPTRLNSWVASTL